MFILFLIVLGFLLTMTLSPLVPVFIIIGIVTYMFSEYLTHRFLFHIKTPNNPLLLKLIKRLHYDHHKIPNDLKLLFLPIWYSFPNLLLLCLIFYVLSGSLLFTLSFSTGLLAMFFVYEWKHYIAHRPFKPKTRFGQWIKKTHILHHYKNENYWYGVSTPFVDVLFGTLKNEKDVQMSQTAKDLEQRP
ncbi:sterol desaturase family protein [Alkalihalobacillus hwajinpoensis]|nr:sterol desaturase family protein [Pseudalkalibacillus hwajinpoensis]MBF0707835.1 sterol desaturase family protein [Pseudalkalibacillus hwajinpoensis]